MHAQAWKSSFFYTSPAVADRRDAHSCGPLIAEPAVDRAEPADEAPGTGSTTPDAWESHGMQCPRCQQETPAGAPRQGHPCGLLPPSHTWTPPRRRADSCEDLRFCGRGRARANPRAGPSRFGRRPRVVDIEELRRRREAGQGWRRIARLGGNESDQLEDGDPF